MHTYLTAIDRTSEDHHRGTRTGHHNDAPRSHGHNPSHPGSHNLHRTSHLHGRRWITYRNWLRDEGSTIRLIDWESWRSGPIEYDIASLIGDKIITGFPAELVIAAYLAETHAELDTDILASGLALKLVTSTVHRLRRYGSDMAAYRVETLKKIGVGTYDEVGRYVADTMGNL